MATLYKRPRSPFFWIKFTDASGKTHYESTKLRHDDIQQARQARNLLADFEAEAAERTGNEEAFAVWVRPFLNQRYGNKPYTLGRYIAIWETLAQFLNGRQITFPRQLSRQHVRDYLVWRTRTVSKNTALHELKILRLIMFEAVQLGYARVNPCQNTRIGKDPARRKPRITEAEHRKILAALEKEPEWMRVCYLIAWHQGCRLTETQVLLSDVDLRRKVIGFRTKGHKAHVAEFPLNPALVPLIETLKSEGREVACKLPKGASKYWTMFFRKIGLPHLCFHCLRVTFVTRCREHGINRDDVMRLVGHATVVAHEVYPRLTADHSSAQSMIALVA